MSGFSVTLIWRAATRFFTCAGHKQDDGSDPAQISGSRREEAAENGSKTCVKALLYSDDSDGSVLL